MKRFLLIAVALTLCVCWAGMSLASTPAEAEANVKAAIAMVKAKGVDETLKAIADPKGPFCKGDLYIWAGSLDKVQMVAHPYKPKLVGRDLSMFKDTNGKQFFNEFVKVAKEKGSGWVDYMWPKPGEKKPSPKTSYVERVPGENLYFGCGVYK
jgi:cytochrome c